MIARAFEDVTEADLESLVSNGTAEQRTLEFKRELSLDAERDRLKFVQNISSFANAQGGDVLYGIDAPNGVAIEIRGIKDADRDALILNFEDLLISGVEPRICKTDSKCHRPPCDTVLGRIGGLPALPFTLDGVT